MDTSPDTSLLAGTRFAAELRRQLEGAAAGAASGRAATGGRRRLAVALATAVVGAVLALLLVGLPALREGRLTVPEPASAAERMMAKLDGALATVRTLSGDLEYVSYRDYFGGVVRRRGSFIAAADGSLRLETVNLAVADPEMDGAGVGAAKSFVYDAAHHRALRLVRPVRGSATFSAESSAPPEWATYPENSPFAYKASLPRLREAMARGDAQVSVTDTRYEGRPAWAASWVDYVTEDTSGSAAAWFTFAITVDKATGVVLHFRIASDGAQDHGYDELTLSHVRVNGPVPADAFTLTPPKRVHRSGGDLGYRFGEPAALRADLAFPVVAPEDLPAGYALADAATAQRESSLAMLLLPRSPAGAFGRGSQPRALHLWYRRGFEAIAVRVDPVLPTDPPVSRDSLVRWAKRPFGRTLRVTPVTGGALAGATAYGWTSHDGAGLLVTSPELTVWVTGDAAPDELLRLAASLRELER